MNHLTGKYKIDIVSNIFDLLEGKTVMRFSVETSSKIQQRKNHFCANRGILNRLAITIWKPATPVSGDSLIKVIKKRVILLVWSEQKLIVYVFQTNWNLKFGSFSFSFIYFKWLTNQTNSLVKDYFPPLIYMDQSLMYL